MKPRSPLSESEKQKATLLHASGKSATYIGKGMARSHHTVQKFLDKPETRKQVSVQREELAARFDSITDRVLRSVTDENIEKSTLSQKMIAAGIATDKSALLRGEMPQTIDVSALLAVVHVIRDRDRQEEERQIRMIRDRSQTIDAMPDER